MATRNVEWLDTSLLDINEGQMEGLPKNPRTWTKDELNKLKKSLEETPELFEARPILAYDYDGRLLVLGGNMRRWCELRNIGGNHYSCYSGKIIEVEAAGCWY